MKKIPKITFLTASFPFIFYLIYRLINQAQMIKYFPLDHINDYSAHMIMLWFLDKFGFHQVTDLWYGGYKIFVSYVPGWAFFTYPIYKIFLDIQLSTYISLVLLFFIGFILIYLISLKEKINFSKSIFFFSIVLCNAMAIGNFLRLGRVTEFFGWISFLLVLTILIYYKKKELTYLFYILLSISLAISIISHMVVVVLIPILLLSFILYRKDRGKALFNVCASGITAIAITSVWLFGYIQALFHNTVFTHKMGERLLEFSGIWLYTNIAISIIIISLFIVVYFYYKSEKDKRELLFLLPILILGFLVLTRLIVFIPFLSSVYPDSYMMFFIIFTILFFLKTRRFPKYLLHILVIIILLTPLVSITINEYHTPKFVKHTQTEEDVISLLPLVEDRFMTYDFPVETSYSKAYSCFGPMFYGKASAIGWSSSEIEPEYIETVVSSKEVFGEDCNQFHDDITYLDIDSIFSYQEGCTWLESCGYKTIGKEGEICLCSNKKN